MHELTACICRICHETLCATDSDLRISYSSCHEHGTNDDDGLYNHNRNRNHNCKHSFPAEPSSNPSIRRSCDTLSSPSCATHPVFRRTIRKRKLLYMSCLSWPVTSSCDDACRRRHKACITCQLRTCAPARVQYGPEDTVICGTVHARDRDAIVAWNCPVALDKAAAGTRAGDRGQLAHQASPSPARRSSQTTAVMSCLCAWHDSDSTARQSLCTTSELLRV